MAISNIIRKFRTYSISKKGTISGNTIAAASQAILVSIALFLVYRTVVESIGIEQLGVWSLLMAGSALARAGDISGAGALGRFVAMINADHNVGGSLVEVTHTIIITSVIINTAFAILIYFTGPYIIQIGLPRDLVGPAVQLLPFMGVVIVLSGVSIAILSGIDGAQRIDQRAVIVVSNSIVTLLLAYFLVPKFELKGLFCAYIISQLLAIFCGWAVLRRHFPEIGIFPKIWRRETLHSTLGYSLKLNLNSALTILFEPLVKVCLGATGGAAQIAYYEIASRVVTQIRGFVVAASMSIVPAIAGLRTDETHVRDRIISDATTILSFVSIAVSIASFVITPLAGYLIVGGVSQELIFIAVPLIFAWSVHLPSVPVYLVAQVDGRMVWNTTSHLGLALAVVLGAAFSSNGDSSALMISIVAGLIFSALVVFVGNVHMLDIYSSVRRVIPRVLFCQFVVSVVSLLVLYG